MLSESQEARLAIGNATKYPIKQRYFLGSSRWRGYLTYDVVATSYEKCKKREETDFIILGPGPGGVRVRPPALPLEPASL